MLADIAAFAQNPFTLHPDEILTMDVALTVIDGRPVHRTL
jgi:predicted amidohydrolase YtcJ